MKKKKSNPTLDIVKNTVIGGTGLMIGSVGMNKVSGMAPGNAHVAGIESSAQGALGIGAMGMPIGAAGGLMKQVSQMSEDIAPPQKKKKGWL